MEINNIVSDALSSAFPRQEFVFTITELAWSTTSRDPTETSETLTLYGRIQPLSSAELFKLGFSTTENEYYRVFINDVTPTQADWIKNNKSSSFIYDGETYDIVGKFAWDTNNWRELICYKRGVSA